MVRRIRLALAGRRRPRRPRGLAAGWTRAKLLGALTVVTVPGAVAALPGGDLRADLRQRLDLPAAASLRAYSTNTYLPVSREDAEAARAHFRRNYSTCAVANDAGDAHILSILRQARPNVGGGDPACLINSASGGEDQELFERVWYLDGCFRIERTMTTREGELAGSLFGVDVVDRTGWTRWSSADGSTTHAGRWPVDGTEPLPGVWRFASIPGMLGWGRDAARAIEEILDLALDQGSLEEDGEELRFSADLRNVRDLATLHGRSLPVGSGFNETPGFVDVTYARTGESAALRMEWSDCEGWTVVSREMAWEGDGVWPCSLRDRYFVVGTRATWRETAGGISVVDSGEISYDDIAWKPLAGQRVLDNRFGPTVTYFIDRDGSAPPDEEIGMMAVAEHVLLGRAKNEDPLAVGASVEDEPGARHSNDAGAPRRETGPLGDDAERATRVRPWLIGSGVLLLAASLLVAVRRRGAR